MKILSSALLILLVILQYQLWFGDGSVTAVAGLNEQLQEQQAVNSSLQQRNKQLEIEVLDLKNGSEAIEERARAELGMIGKDETFYLIVN
ncbi:MAG: cell division protein FtsB [SAR86 cluster bacterium]|uniref:Cell division protein FtsB n=1 Tax=SAR86 cluster bacterium TaxID=2030880 RepID=A0A2A4MML6_9GAMM|nr:MAG: cell division protein FtsB [SAR86 cluster bacterium]